MIAYALSLLAGAVLPFAFAPFEQFWIAPLSYAALLYAWRGVSSRARVRGRLRVRVRELRRRHVLDLHRGARSSGGAPIALAVALTVGLTLVLAAFVGAAGFMAARWFRTSGAAAWLVTLPALFVLTEWRAAGCSRGSAGSSAGYSQTDSWLMGYAPLLGIHGISWAVLAIAGALVTLAVWVADTSRGRAPARVGAAAAACAAVVLVAISAVGAMAGSRAWTTPKETTLSVALIQGAIAQDVKWKPEQLPGMLELYAGLTQQSLGADLIVWPEAADPDADRVRAAVSR